MRLTRHSTATLALVLASCGPSDGQDVVRDVPEAASCAERLPAEQAAVAEAPPFRPPPSQLAVHVRVPTKQLRAALEKQVPEVLASGQRTVGPGGRLTYHVRRGDVGLGVDGEHLIVTVPVKASAHLCIPVGPFCPSLGSCGPALTTTVRVPLLLDERGGFGKSKVSVRVDRGCALGGVDATGHFVGAAKSQTAQLERRVDESLSSVRPVIRSVWAGLHEPVPVADEACLRPRWQRLVQQAPALADDALSLRLALLGELRLERPCASGSDAAQPPALPAAELVDAVPTLTKLTVPVRMGWADVSGQLTEAMANGSSAAPEPARIAKLSARGARADDATGGRVALALTLTGERCGEAWMLAEPWVDEPAGQVRLRDARLAPGQPARAQRLADDALEQRIAERASLRLPPEAAPAAQSLRTLVEREAQRHGRHATIDAELAPQPSWTVAVSAESLVPLATQQGTIQVQPK